VIGPTEPVFVDAEIAVQGLDSSWAWRHQGGRLRASSLDRAAATLAAAPPGALRVVALHHHLAGAPWRATRKLPLRSRDRVLERFRAMGVDLVLGGHIHQSTAVGLSDIANDDGRPGRRLALATAPGFGRPRPHHLGEAHGVNVVEWTSEAISVITLSWDVSSGEAGTFLPAARRLFCRANLP